MSKEAQRFHAMTIHHEYNHIIIIFRHHKDVGAHPAPLKLIAFKSKAPESLIGWGGGGAVAEMIDGSGGTKIRSLVKSWHCELAPTEERLEIVKDRHNTIQPWPTISHPTSFGWLRVRAAWQSSSHSDLSRANSRAEDYNSYQVKRRSGGGAQFTRDPLNLLNKQTRQHTGFVNESAIGITPGEKGGVSLTTKKGGKKHQPGAQHQRSTLGGNKGSGTRKWVWYEAECIKEISHRITGPIRQLWIAQPREDIDRIFVRLPSLVPALSERAKDLRRMLLHQSPVERRRRQQPSHRRTLEWPPLFYSQHRISAGGQAFVAYSRIDELIWILYL